MFVCSKYAVSVSERSYQATQLPKKEKTQEMGMVFCFGILIFN